MMYLEFTLGQSQEHFLSVTRTPSLFSLGVPESVMVDNCKTAVLSHPLGQPAQFNPRYLDFANHYGFKVRACGVRKGNEKGRVENGVKYVKENFLRGLELPPWPPSIQQAAIGWTPSPTFASTARRTRHRSELFAEEKSKLNPSAGLALRHRPGAPVTRQQSLPCAVGNQPLLRPGALGRDATLTAKIYADRVGPLSPGTTRRRACPLLRSAP